MKKKIYLLKSVDQYIDLKGDIYTMDCNGNIDDMVDNKLGNVINVPHHWWDTLSSYDLKIADIIFGGIADAQHN